jgi:tRNA A22 N-methylase
VTTPELSPRLSTAFDLLDSTAVIFDVGADRGLLSLAVAQRGQTVYASENKKGPFTGLAKTAADSRLPNFHVLFQDGLAMVPPDVNAIVILGMGGRTMLRILKQGKTFFSQLRLVLIEPQSEFELPLDYLLDNGFENDNGCYVEETRFYPLLRFVPRKEAGQETELERTFGPYPVRHHDPMLLAYAKKEKDRLCLLPKPLSADNQTKMDQMERILAL